MRDGENGGLVVARDSDNLVWMFVMTQPPQ